MPTIYIPYVGSKYRNIETSGKSHIGLSLQLLFMDNILIFLIYLIASIPKNHNYYTFNCMQAGVWVMNIN